MSLVGIPATEISFVKFDKLNFITAGMPLRTGKGSYTKAFDSNTPIKVIAKIKHNTNNDVYYISDIIPNRQNE